MKQVKEINKMSKEQIIEWAYEKWWKGNFYKMDGAFYDMLTNEYICPVE